MLDLAEVETDRIVNYAIWGALTDLLSVEERKKLRWDKRSSIRLAALLGLLEEDALTEEEIEESTKDSHFPIKNLAKKRLGGKHRFEHRGRPLEATGDFHQEKPWRTLKTFRLPVAALIFQLFCKRESRTTRIAIIESQKYPLNYKT